ncbi:MAG: ATP-binding cassette domain-containing protein [Candidatus Cloacimonetes bacterium]|nr:ATP-binding cassette domain-containing protein [Candidatus Cloacimonadota bacterium]
MIELKNLVKDYGSLRAVDKINFQIKEGEILGFLGPNGAGKSTTLKMITCFLTPTDGNIQIGELNVHEHSKEIRKMIGYLPEHNPLYLEMTVFDYLKFVSEVREISEKDFKVVLTKTIKKCGLTEVISRPIKTLSKGFRQRVGIAQAIIHDPKILILDEPTSGLDPNQIIEIRELIKELGREKTLVISSHILQEVQAVCDRIVIINKGKIVGQGTTEELRMSHQRKAKLYLEINTLGDQKESILQTFQRELPKIDIAIKSVDNQSDSVQTKESEIESTIKIELSYPQEKDYRKDVYELIKKQEWIILEMQRHISSLEDIFRNLTSGGKNV